jgi:arginase
MDCDLISYGTGTPVSKGFDEVEIKEIISGFLETEKVACLEFVEINPTLDEKKNKMAETAFEILEEVLPIIEKLNN